MRAESSAVLAWARNSSSFATRVTSGVIASATLSVLIFVATVGPAHRKLSQTTTVDFPKVAAFLDELGEPAYRSRQVYEGATRGFAQSYDELTPLPVALRQRLQAAVPLRELTTDQAQHSVDGTIKLRMTTTDGFPVETVAMRHRDRSTVCVSSQSGCPLKCTFCATGSMGLGRNLTQGEIVEQVLVLAGMLREQERRVTNVVMMGMGEPFLNYDEVLAACRTLNDPAGFGLGARQIAVSTAGWIPGIERLAAEPMQLRLALSLHAPNDELRADADAGQPALPAGQADGRLPGLPGGHRPPDLHRVPAAGRGQRHQRARRRSWPACSPAAATTST